MGSKSDGYPGYFDQRIRNLKPSAEHKVKAEKDKKKALLSASLPAELLYTATAIADPRKEDRAWIVQADAPVIPIIEDKSGKYGALNGKITGRTWQLVETKAHHLDFAVWDWAALPDDVRDGRDYNPYFIEFEDKIPEGDVNLVGFIVGSTSVLCPKPEKGFVTQLGLGQTLSSKVGAVDDAGVPVPPTPIGIISSPHKNKKKIASVEMSAGSNPGQKYNFEIYDDLMASCECPGWTNRKKCKHFIKPEVEKVWQEKKKELDDKKAAAKANGSPTMKR